MSTWYELVERDHDLQNPTSAEKIRRVGSYLRLRPGTRVLDLACAKAGPALILAREFGCRVDGIDVSTVFVEAARRRIAEARLEDLVSVEVGDARQVPLEPGGYDVALCLGAAFVWRHIGDAAAVLAAVVGPGRMVAVGEPFWRRPGRDERGFVDLAATVARYRVGAGRAHRHGRRVRGRLGPLRESPLARCGRDRGDDIVETHLGWRDI